MMNHKGLNLNHGKLRHATENNKYPAHGYVDCYRGILEGIVQWTNLLINFQNLYRHYRETGETRSVW